jgi:hypothetical protein
MQDQLLKIVTEYENQGIIIADEGIFNKNALKNYLRCGHSAPVPIKAINNYLLSAINLIPYLVKKTSRKGLLNSYHFKHCVEKRIAGGYISNGELILAMVFLGYKPCLGADWNCSFHCQLVDSDGTNAAPVLF